MNTRFFSKALIGVAVGAVLLMCAGPAVLAADEAPAPAPAAPAPAAGSSAGGDDVTIVAKVNDMVITKEEFDRALASQMKNPMMHPPQGSPGEAAPKPTAEAEKQLIQQMIDSKLFALIVQQANIEVSDEELATHLNDFKSQFASEEELKARLASADVTLEQLPEKMRESIARNKYAKTLSDSITVSDEDVQKMYDELKAGGQMKRPEETVDVAHVLVLVKEDADEAAKNAAKEKIDAAYKRATEGKEDFAKIAKELSEDPGSKDNGGLYSDTPRGRMVPEFEKAMFETPVGEISQPFTTKYGWHIVKTIARHPAGDVPYEEAKEVLRQGMRDPRGPLFQTKLKEKLEEVRSKTKIDILYTPKDTEPAPSVVLPLNDAAPASSDAAAAGGGA